MRIGLVVSALSVAAFGGLSVRSAGAAGGGLCANLASIEQATVTRVNLLHNKYGPFEFPARVSVTSPVLARSLASAVCGLPRFPAGVFACPMDLGLRYRVQFNGQVGPVTIDPAGCETVSGAGPVRRASSGFWPKFGRVLGLKKTTDATFRGRLR